MKSSKLNSLNRLLSFLLIAVMLVCIVGFASSGMQSAPNEPDSGENGNTTDNTDENTDGNNEQKPPQSNDPPSDDTLNNDNNNTPPSEPILPIDPPIEEPIKYYNPATGIETTEELSKACPIGFVINPEMPMYGISSSDISIEFPIENGKSRLLTYTTNPSLLWKVGALAPTRAFISMSQSFFGGIVVSYKNDDIIKYSAWDASKIALDISKFEECYFIENTLYVYTSQDLVNSALNKTDKLSNSPYKSMPFVFSDLDKPALGPVDATTLRLPYSENNESTFYYSETSNKYLFFKSGKRKVDMLNGQNISYTNVFVLFANATTYEMAEGTELVIDTTSGGSGYYISQGKMSEIRWKINDMGELVFTGLSGELLKINRGNTYIGYYKASNASLVTIN